LGYLGNDAAKDSQPQRGCASSVNTANLLTRDGRNRVAVEKPIAQSSQGSPKRQPWALWRSPFGAKNRVVKKELIRQEGTDS